MGRLFLQDLEGRSYTCKFCNVPLALEGDVISKAFWAVHGAAYLFGKAVNVYVSMPENRITMYAVVEVFCVRCGSLIGWQYMFAYDNSEEYKGGHFVFERLMILNPEGGEVSDDDGVLGA